MKWYFSVINTVSFGYQTKINEYSKFQRFFFSNAAFLIYVVILLVFLFYYSTKLS